MIPETPIASPSPARVQPSRRTKLAGLPLWIEEGAARLASAGVGWLLWPFVIGMAIGATVWPTLNLTGLADLLSNKLAEPERKRAFIQVVGSVGGTLVVYGLVTLVRRLVSGSWRTAETFAWLNKRLTWILALPLLAVLRMKAFEKENPKLTLFLAAVMAIVAARSIYQIKWPDLRGERPRLLRAAKVGAIVAVIVMWAGYAAWIAHLAITNHRALNTHTADLGYYDNIFWQSLHGHPLHCSFLKGGVHYSGHFDPILVLLSPLYLIYPHAELLLVLQAIWVGSGVVPVYLIAADKLSSRPAGLVLGACFLLYPALHGVNLYEFHSLAFIVPLVLWLIYFLETGRHMGYLVVLALLLLCREDVSLLMCFVGVYALITRQRRSALLGWITILASLAYFGLVKTTIMKSADLLNSGDESTSFAYYYADMIPNKSGVLGLITTLVTNPVFVIKTAFDEPKLIFAAQLLLPLAFVPLMARRARVMLIYGFTFCMLATRSAVYTIHFQYSSAIFPVAFAMTPLALQQIEEHGVPPFFGLDGRRLVRALLAAMVVATAITSWKFGGMVDNATFKGGFTRLIRSMNDEQRDQYAWTREAVLQIPKGASVAASTRLGPHVSGRREAYFYPNPRKHADYVLVDEAELKPEDNEKHQANVTSGKLVEISRRKRLALFKSE